MELYGEFGLGHAGFFAVTLFIRVATIRLTDLTMLFWTRLLLFKNVLILS